MGDKTKNVAKKADAEVGYFDYGDDAGSGFENQTSADVAIPFISIVQSNSAEMNDETFQDKNIKAGQILNRTTGELYIGKPGGFKFIPSYTDHVFVEWIPVDDGGGFVGIHALDSSLVLECQANQPFGKYVVNGGNELVETFYVYGVVVEEGGALTPAVIPFASTNIKAYKDWMFKARAIMLTNPNTGKRFKLPLFAHRYTFSTVHVTKGKQSWYKFDAISFDGKDAVEARLAPDCIEYAEARGVKEGVASGVLKADEKNADRGQPAKAAQDEIPKAGDVGEEDIPF